jgi:hypothetical protein
MMFCERWVFLFKVTDRLVNVMQTWQPLLAVTLSKLLYYDTIRRQIQSVSAASSFLQPFPNPEKAVQWPLWGRARALNLTSSRKSLRLLES